jgi:hypothetical protein
MVATLVGGRHSVGARMEREGWGRMAVGAPPNPLRLPRGARGASTFVPGPRCGVHGAGAYRARRHMCLHVPACLQSNLALFDRQELQNFELKRTK